MENKIQTNAQTDFKWIAADTMEILKKGKYLSPSGQEIDISKQVATSVERTEIYRPDDQLAPVSEQHFETEWEFTSESTLHAAERLSKTEQRIFCLNFASAKNPGGGFQSGAKAQEESLARSSALYPCLVQMKEMYDYNRSRKTMLYSDYMIYAPDVTVFRRDNGALLENPYAISFITSPAVNMGVLRAREVQAINQVWPVMLRRLRKILQIALLHKHEVLLLGAWGCGVFANDPKDIASTFRAQLVDNPEFKGKFRRIVFAIRDRDADKPLIFKNIIEGK